MQTFVKDEDDKIISYIEEGVEFTAKHFHVQRFEAIDYAKDKSESWPKIKMVDGLTLREGVLCLFVGGCGGVAVVDALKRNELEDWIGREKGTGTFFGPEYFGTGAGSGGGTAKVGPLFTPSLSKVLMASVRVVWCVVSRIANERLKKLRALKDFL